MKDLCGDIIEATNQWRKEGKAAFSSVLASGSRFCDGEEPQTKKKTRRAMRWKKRKREKREREEREREEER